MYEIKIEDIEIDNNMGEYFALDKRKDDDTDSFLPIHSNFLEKNVHNNRNNYCIETNTNKIKLEEIEIIDEKMVESFSLEYHDKKIYNFVLGKIKGEDNILQGSSNDLNYLNSIDEVLNDHKYTSLESPVEKQSFIELIDLEDIDNDDNMDNFYEPAPRGGTETTTFSTLSNNSKSSDKRWVDGLGNPPLSKAHKKLNSTKGAGRKRNSDSVKKVPRKLKTSKGPKRKKYQQSESERQMHNSIERLRRIDLKVAFENLRLKIPDLQSNKNASKNKIISTAADYCTLLNKKNQSMEIEIKKLRRYQQKIMKILLKDKGKFIRDIEYILK